MLDLCERLPEGESELDCAEACREARGGAALEGALRCVVAPTCDDLAACRDAADPAALCAALCARRDDCDVGAEDCAEVCEARFDTARVQAELVCTVVAAGCEGVETCVATPPPDCGLLCDAYDGCDLGDERCTTRCDDVDFADPAAYLPELACVLASDCGARRACRDGMLDAGAACLGWCRDRVECEGAADLTMVACLQACGEGLEGRDFLTLDAAGECLAVAPDCEARAGCIDEVAADAYCTDLCDEQARCGLIEDVDACLDACQGASELQVEVGACVVGELRGAGRCRRVAECVGAEVEPAGAGCVSFCARRAECDDDVDAFLCERECTPEPAGFPVRAACAHRSECGAVDACVEADAAIPQGCVDACGGLAEACEDLFGEDRDTIFDDPVHCSVECTAARIVNGSETYLEALPECFAGVECDGERVEACLVEPDSGCDQAWEYVVACMAGAFFPPEDQFLAACDEAQASCIIDQVDGLGGPDPLGLCGLLLVGCL